MKYNREGGNFDFKLRIFVDTATKVDLLEEGYKRAISTMLKGLALDYYYSTLLTDSLSFEQICQAIKDHFEDDNYRRNALVNWNNITLETIKTDNPNKSMSYYFQVLVTTLQKLRHGLVLELQTDAFLKNKLMLACRSLKEC